MVGGDYAGLAALTSPQESPPILYREFRIVRAWEGFGMGWGWAVKAFDASERIRTVAGWLGLPLWGLMTIVWTWLCKIPVVWWPVVAVVSLILFLGMRAIYLHFDAMRLKHEHERFGANIAPGFVEAVVAVLDRQQGLPHRHKLEGDTGISRLSNQELSDRLGIVRDAPPEFMPLREALSQAYDRTKNGVLGPFAQGVSSSAEDVLNWYAYFSVKHIKIYGRQPPGTELDRIPKTAFTRYSFVNGAQDLRGIYEDKPHYTDISVRAEDVPAYLERISEADSEFAFQLGFEEKAKPDAT